MPPIARPSRRTALLGALAAAAGGSALAAGMSPIVTVLGDSITAGLGLPAVQAFPAQLQAALGRLRVPARVRAAGVSGDTTEGGLARLDFSVQPDTAVCVVELGANDFLQSISIARTTANLTAIGARLHQRGIRVVLIGGSAPYRSTGSYGREFDALFPRVARATGAILIPDAFSHIESDPALKQSDGLHPNAQGARLLADRTAPTVARVLSSLLARCPPRRC